MKNRKILHLPLRVEALGRVREIYLELARRPVERACIARTTCCRFRLTGRVPQLTKGEALVAAAALRAHGRKSLPEPVEEGSCPLLKADGKCRIYEGRPFGCRTHFCEAAGGIVPRGEVIDLIRRLEEVDEDLGGRGALPLPVALREVIDG